MRTIRQSLRALFLAVLAVFAAALVAACDDVVKDATFRMWCGESLCAWTVEAGSIRRAATWHKDDHGVELVDTPTVISQRVTDKSPRCLLFSTIADVDPAAQVTIGVDFNADGTIEHEQPIAATGFREAKTLVTAPVHYEGLRFVISKKGAGRAVLAQMRVQSKSKEDCAAPPVELDDLPLGTPCALERGGAECRSGVCCDGLCSECCAESPVGQVGSDGGTIENVTIGCSGGLACERRDVPNGRGFFLPAVPLQCAPGRADRPRGAECLADDDCASGACDGASSFGVTTIDAAPCETDFPDAGGCRLFTSVRGGRCL